MVNALDLVQHNTTQQLSKFRAIKYQNCCKDNCFCDKVLSPKQPFQLSQLSQFVIYNRVLF